MKKKYLVIVFVLIMCLSIFVFTACGNKSGETGSGGSDETLGLSQQEVTAKLDNMQASNGYKITMNIATTTSGATTTVSSTMAANGSLYYLKTDAEEYIYDLTSNVSLTTYHKADAETQWTKTETNYTGEYFTKEYQEGMIKASFNAMVTWLMFAGTYVADSSFIQTSVVVAGRPCTSYDMSISIMGQTARLSIAIDNATKMCLKFTALSGTVAGTNASSFECTEFSENYTITLPTVNPEA